MSTKDWWYVTGATVTLVLLWWLHRRSLIVPAAEPQGAWPRGWDTPMNDVYNANPGAYLPPTDTDLTVNVGNQLANLLSEQYIPLFGFVGIAQGQLFQ